MSPQDDNYALKAQLDGMDRYMRVSFENVQRQLDGLADTHAKIARLESRTDVLKEKIRDMEDDSQTRSSKVSQWAGIISVALIGIGTMVVNLLAVIGHG